MLHDARHMWSWRQAGRLLPVAWLVACLVAAPCAAQAPAATAAAEADVIATVQRLFDAMATCDASAARAVTVGDGVLFRMVDTPEGPTRLGHGTLEAFAASLEGCRRRMLERMWAPEVRVHGDIASLWAPYDFWLDGAFSHCGIDSFDLARTADGWRIVGGIYTVERTGCAPSPLGPPPPPPARVP